MTTTRLCAPTPEQLRRVLCAPPAARTHVPARLRELLAARLATSTAPSGRAIRLGAFDLERDRGFTSPFSWSARTARRALGTASARALSQGTAPDALSAARDEVERLCDRSARGLVRPGSLAAWLAAEPPVVRATSALAGATWAGSLLDVIGVPDAMVHVGVADAWHDVAGAGVTLHGRRDALAACADHSSRAVLRLRDGAPSARALEGLALEGLVDALAASDDTVAARVVGSWPDAGVCLAVELDADAIRAAARSIVACAQRRGAQVDDSAPIAA